jgi:hypothetical protein
MPGQRGSETRRLTIVKTFRMDNDLAARCADAADAANLTMTDWMRYLVADAVQWDGEEARRSKPRVSTKSRPDQLVRILVLLADQLAELAAVLTAVRPDEAVPVNPLDLQRLLAETRSVSAVVVDAIEMAVRK